MLCVCTSAARNFKDLSARPISSAFSTRPAWHGDVAEGISTEGTASWLCALQGPSRGIKACLLILPKYQVKDSLTVSVLSSLGTLQGLSDVSAVALIPDMQFQDSAAWGVLGCLHWPELLYTLLLFTNRRSRSPIFS